KRVAETKLRPSAALAVVLREIAVVPREMSHAHCLFQNSRARKVAARREKTRLSHSHPAGKRIGQRFHHAPVNRRMDLQMMVGVDKGAWQPRFFKHLPLLLDLFAHQLSACG